MKLITKTKVVATVLLLSTLPALSQTHYSSNVSIGVKGGVDLSRVMFTPSVKQGFLQEQTSDCRQPEAFPTNHL